MDIIHLYIPYYHMRPLWRESWVVKEERRLGGEAGGVLGGSGWDWEDEREAARR